MDGNRQRQLLKKKIAACHFALVMQPQVGIYTCGEPHAILTPNFITPPPTSGSINSDMANYILLLLSLSAAIFCSLSFAFEPSPLQDFCVADSSPSALVNGLACKDPKLVQASDFFFSDLHLPGNTSNPLGSKVTPVNVAQLPGLNTLGISMVRIDYAPWGVNPPHTHPRASEILTVLEGSLIVGFVTSNPDNRLITKVLRKGDVFVFPVGLVHFQRNAGYAPAVAVATLSSQNPGAISIANAVFGSNPAIPIEVLSKAFQVDHTVVSKLQMNF